MVYYYEQVTHVSIDIEWANHFGHSDHFHEEHHVVKIILVQSMEEYTNETLKIRVSVGGWMYTNYTEGQQLNEQGI